MNNLSHSDEIILDVRDMNCEVRCPLVKQTYSNLNPGESFVLVHAFEPLPLKNKLENLTEHEVGWESLERGNGFVKVRIGKIARVKS